MLEGSDESTYASLLEANARLTGTAVEVGVGVGRLAAVGDGVGRSVALGVTDAVGVAVVVAVEDGVADAVAGSEYVMISCGGSTASSRDEKRALNPLTEYLTP